MELRSMTSPRRCISPRHRRPPECQLGIGVNTVETVDLASSVEETGEAVRSTVIAHPGAV